MLRLSQNLQIGQFFHITLVIFSSSHTFWYDAIYSIHFYISWFIMGIISSRKSEEIHQHSLWPRTARNVLIDFVLEVPIFFSFIQNVFVLHIEFFVDILRTTPPGLWRYHSLIFCLAQFWENSILIWMFVFSMGYLLSLATFSDFTVFFGLYTIKMSCVYILFFSYPIWLSFLDLCFDFIHFPQPLSL